MPILTKNTFMELVSSYHKNPERFVFFVGAGLSQPLFPSWGNLLKEFVAHAKESGLHHDEKELLGYIEKGENYLDVAAACVKAMGLAKYRGIMERIFDKEFTEDEIPESYKALMELSPNLIVTTNYDRIPDVAGKGRYRVSTNKTAPEASRHFANDKPFVFKVHGDITDQSSIVLTAQDYQEIIHNNPSTKSMLSSLLSTKLLIFIGFSLSDPHINKILDNIKTINEGMPLSHYVLLNETSTFKISSFAENYGVNIISYDTSDPDHPEVVEFLRALNHKTGSIPEQVVTKNNIEITEVGVLIEHIDKAINEVIVGAGFSVFYNNGDICLSFTPSGETKAEVQKEILSIIKLMDFECEILNCLNIFLIAKTPPIINVDESQTILLKVKVKHSDAKKYAEKVISISTIWKLMEFYSPASLSNAFQREERVDFPMSTGIVGKQL